MGTQKFRGKGQLVKRLAAQVGGKALAANILKKRGDMAASGALTAMGEKRNKMTAASRAKDRAAKQEHKPTTAFKYNPRTNTAKLKGK